uniref:Fe2OG dioxygenase domain-containing protein n=1 Tax=Eutreptiella gymnastica TaxID=73025 RepID=A0A7S4CXB1_9EUGL
MATTSSLPTVAPSQTVSRPGIRASPTIEGVHSVKEASLQPIPQQHPHTAVQMNQEANSWLSPMALVFSATIAGLVWLWRRNTKPNVLEPIPFDDWAMANVSVNPELLKRFGIEPPVEDPYAGLADTILARKAPDGVPSNADDDAVGYSKSELAKDMASKYLPFDLDCPGMKVHSVDPPILTIDGFLDDADCDALMAETPSILQSSTIGAGKLEGSQGVELSQRRTSSSVLLDQNILKLRPSIAEPTSILQKRAMTLFPGAKYGPAGQLPPPGTICFESLQVARYEPGQLFMGHQDGFPLITARRNEFQRLATILVYLNDVPEGGNTRFQHLDLSFTPKKGTAVVFFPGFIDGRPDDRLLHEATAAVDEKWVAQQWVAVGVAARSAASSELLDGLDVARPDDLVARNAELEEQNRIMKEKMAAMEAHNAQAMQALEAQKKAKKKAQKKAAMPPKKGFGK